MGDGVRGRSEVPQIQRFFESESFDSVKQVLTQAATRVETTVGKFATGLTTGEARRVAGYVASGKVKHVILSEDKQTAYYLPVQNFLKSATQEIMREVSIMQTVKERLGDRSNSCLQTEATVAADGRVSVPAADGGDLEKNMRKPLEFQQRLKLCWQCLQAFKSLHEAGFAHGDVKPDNFLVFGNEIKLADFGKAEDVQVATAAGKYSGNTRFGPPEGKLSQKGDTYGAGLCLIRILEEQFLQGKEKDEAMLVAVKTAKERPAEEKRRGIERYVLQHGDCQRTSEEKGTGFKGKVDNFLRRVLTIAGKLSPYALKKEKQVIDTYIDALCKKIEDAGQLASVEPLRELLKEMTAINSQNRITSEEAFYRFEAIMRSTVAP